MDTDAVPTTPADRPRRRRKIAGAGLVAAGLVAGGVLATSMGASADTTSTATSSSASSTAQPGTRGPGGAAAVRSDETVVTGSKAATLKAAALKAVPGGTVVRIETDAGDGAYEAHMTKADGTVVTVKFDQNLAVTAVESGMGKGDPAPSGAPAGAPTGASAGGTAPTGGSAA